MEGLLPELEVIRKDFPILERTLANGQGLVYLDSANTSQKPQVVIDTMVDHLERHNANISRAMHQLGAESTEAFEDARDKVAAFIGAPSRDGALRKAATLSRAPSNASVDSEPSVCMAREMLALCRSRWSTMVSTTTCGFCEVLALSR